MKGHSLIIPAGVGPRETDAAMRASVVEYDRPITLDELQAGVGGSIEVVPEFSCMRIENEEVSIVAFCNEEGRIHGLPENYGASIIYEAAVAVERDDEDFKLDPQWRLVGPIMVVWGDEEFMNGL